MHRSFLSLPAAGLLLPLAALASPSTGVPDRVPAPEGPVPSAEARVLEGPPSHEQPFRAADPAVQARLEELHSERSALHEDTRARLEELNRRAAGADPATLQAIRDEGVRLKETLRVRHIELCLEIAELRGDTARAAELGRALVQVRDEETERSRP